MASYTNDFELWSKMMINMPFGYPGGKTAEEAATKPGNCVKSRERDPANFGFPKFHGRLLQYSNECIVLGYNDPVSESFVWRSTQEEYHSFWEVD